MATLKCCQLDHKEHFSVRFYLDFNSIRSRESTWKCLRNGGRLVRGVDLKDNNYNTLPTPKRCMRKWSAISLYQCYLFGYRYRWNCYWFCCVNEFLSSTSKDCNHLRKLSLELVVNELLFMCLLTKWNTPRTTRVRATSLPITEQGNINSLAIRRYDSNFKISVSKSLQETVNWSQTGNLPSCEWYRIWYSNPDPGGFFY